MQSPFIDDAVKRDRAVRALEVDCTCGAEILWHRVDGEWTAEEVKAQIDQAVAWFRKYCIPLDFREFKLDPAKDKEIKKDLDARTAEYKAAVGAVQKGKAPPTSDPLTVIQAKLLRLYKVIADKEKADRKANPPPEGTPKQLMTVLFTDEWFVNTSELGDSRTFRVTAVHPTFWLIAILRYDRASRNMLTHELLHLLRRDCSEAGRNGKCLAEFIKTNRVTDASGLRWPDHYAGNNQARAMSRPTRTKAFDQENGLDDDDVLSVKEYLTILSAGYVGCQKGCAQPKAGGGKAQRRKREVDRETPFEGDPLADLPFGFTGIETPQGIVELSWGGRPPVAGLAGFDLFRRVRAPGGNDFIKLNNAPLPLNATFVDQANSSLPELDSDPFETLLAGRARTGFVRGVTIRLEDWLDLFASVDGSALPPAGPPGPRFVPRDAYLLVGVFQDGEPDGEHQPEKVECTEEQREYVRKRIKVVLEGDQGIKERGLVEKLRPNPDKVTYDELLKHVRFEVDCGEIGVLGQTSPDGVIKEGSKRFKSKITINGARAARLAVEEFLALLLHELAHALQNYNGLSETAPTDMIIALADRIRRETAAYSTVWDLIAAGDVKLPALCQCSEMAVAIRVIIMTYEMLAKRLSEAELKLTDAQKAEIKAMRTEVRALLLKYKASVEKLPAEDKAKCTFRQSDGEELILEVIDGLLKGAFKE